MKAIKFLYPLLVLLYIIGATLYLASKLLRALSHLLMFHPHSAKEEIRNFFSIKSLPQDY